MTSSAPERDHAPRNAAPSGDGLVRPQRYTPAEPPPLPQVNAADADAASVEYSHYRTGLSNHRTSLSEHRTDLSEFRTDLSTHRTALSEHRTALSTDRTDMSMRRTGMSFQRTRMSADRTLMSIIRTALSLIGFGFTIYQVFSHMVQQAVHVGFTSHAPRNFGVALVLLGIALLSVGMVYHVQYMRSLRAEREQMVRDGLLHGDSPYPPSVTLMTAAALWLIGVLAIASMIFDVPSVS